MRGVGALFHGGTLSWCSGMFRFLVKGSNKINMNFVSIVTIVLWCLAGGEAQLAEDCDVNRCPRNEVCFNRFYSAVSDYVCECSNGNVGFDCTVDLSVTSQDTCYGSNCINGSFTSPNWPSIYFNQDRRVYLIFVPFATRLTFTFDPIFNIESDGDELYIGAGLSFDADSDLNSMSNETKQVYFFEGTTAPDSFTVENTDSAWLYWRTDSAGRFAGFRVTWQATLDTTSPTVDCPTDQVLYVDMGDLSAPFAYQEPIATDEGVVRILSQSHQPGDEFFTAESPVPVIYRFVDAAGNIAPACVFFVYIIQEDMSPPVVDCPGDFTHYVMPGVTSAEVFYDKPTATDNGGPALLLAQSHTPGDTFPMGSTLVSYTFEDLSGNIAPDCMFFVHVTDSFEDTLPPIVTCPSDLSRSVPEGVTSLVVDLPSATAVDNSGTTSLVSVDPPSGTSFPLGTTDVTYTYEDPSGNVGDCVLSVMIYVEDTTPPVPTCPSNITRSIPQGMASLVVTFSEPTATDNMGTATLVSVEPPSGSLFPLGTTDVIATFEDQSGNIGNCSFQVTVIVDTTADTSPPVVTCPPDIIRSVVPGQTSLAVTFPVATATDNSGTASLVSVEPPPGSLFPLGTADVVFTFADPSGNIGTCTFTVTVDATAIDNIPPDVTCPGDIALPVQQGMTSLEVTFPNATATDNSGTASLVSVVPSSGSMFQIGTTDVWVVFEDPSGNEGSCTFSVTITSTPDTSPPMVTCPQDITRSVPEGQPSLVVFFQSASANDDSGTTSLLRVDPPSGSSFPPGPNSVIFSFIDPSGNVGNCTFTVTIVIIGPTGCGNSSCENGGTCVTVGDDSVCECLQGFVGELCEIDINECSSLPCLNGGTCVEGAGWFSCQCRQGYSGVNCEIVEFCDLEGDWYNECNDRLSLSPTSTGLILGNYYSNIELISGYADPAIIVGYVNRKCYFSSFGFIVTRNNGKSTGGWSGQCHLCAGEEVLYTTWTHRVRVDTCQESRRATRVGQDKWTRYRQSQAPREL